MGFWVGPVPPSSLNGADRSLTEQFGGLDDDYDNELEDADYIDEFASFLDEPKQQHEQQQEPTVSTVGRSQPVQQQQESSSLKFLIPSIPTTNQVTSNNSTLNKKDNVIKTKKEMKKEYRQKVAIPRYLAKRQRRCWEKKLMHHSRSIAAQRRPRNGGQFGVVDARFTPCVSSTSSN
jgi:CRISPR/Cas system CSM-associated protein Csm3 (group 7 of RAMP superfamily)